MDAKSPTKGSKKSGRGLFSKAKGLIKSNKNLDESDTTGDTDTQWKSEGDLGFDPASNSPSTPKSLPDSNTGRRQARSRTRKATLAKSPGSPGSLAGQKIRRSNIDILAGPPLEKGGMSSVNDSEMAVVSPKKSKRRKSLSTMNDAKEKARSGRERRDGKTKRSNSQPRISTKGLTGKGNSSKNTGEGVNDLMAHLGSPDVEAELKDNVVLSPSGKARTTVDRNGKIRRVSSKKKLQDEDTSDGEQSKRSTKSKKKGKKAKDGEAKKKRRPVPDETDAGTVFSAPPAIQRKKEPRSGKKPGMDTSAHSGDESEKSSKKKFSKRDLTDSDDDDDSEKKAKKKAPKRDALDSSNHSSKKEGSKRILDPSEDSPKVSGEKAKLALLRKGRKGDGLSTSLSPRKRPSKAKSVPDLYAMDPAHLKRRSDATEGSGMKSGDSTHHTPPGSSKSFTEGDKDQLGSRIKALTLENETAQAELQRLRKELREVKLESQRSHTERRELRADLREREFVIKESDMRIEALEKAVETQLDKIEDMEEELRKANEEVFMLEEKLSHMEAQLTDAAAVEGGGIKKEREMGEKRQQRLERRLEEKEKELAEREQALREERRLLLKDGQPNRSSDQLEQDNRMLLKAMNREKAEAEEKMQEKDAEIEALKTELQRNGVNGYAGASPASGDSKKDDQIASMEAELKKLKQELADRDQGDTDKLKRELQAARNEGQAMKSKYEGAQRRNLILEDEIDHWKSVNCNLEDDLAEQKMQTASWREKYEDAVDVPDGHEERGYTDAHSMGSGWGRSVGKSPAELAMGRGDDSDDEKTVNTISGLWSKLTTPQQKKQSVGGTLPSGSLSEVIARSTFH